MQICKIAPPAAGDQNLSSRLSIVFEHGHPPPALSRHRRAHQPSRTRSPHNHIELARVGSYRIPPAWLQKKLAPFSLAAPPISGGGGINSSTILGEAGADNAANCFDLSVLRETPTRLLPKSCGGTQ